VAQDIGRLGRRQKALRECGIIGVDHVDKAIVARAEANSGLTPVKLM